MKLYWGLKSIPELEGLPFRLRWNAWFACVNKAMRHWRVKLAFYLAVAIPGSIYILLLIAYDNILFGLAVYCVLSLPTITIFNQIRCEAIRPYLKKYVAEHNKRE